MTLTPKILSIIQKAGTAIFAADVALKNAVADSAKKMSDALIKNPVNEQHDSLYQDWKNVARISKAISTIEAELKTVYALASATPNSNGPAIALPAPVYKAPLKTLSSIDVTDVTDKRIARKLKTVKKPVKGSISRAKRSDGQDNTAKVFGQLQSVLNDQTFTKLNQSSIAVAVGLPKGSIGASIKKLIKDGKLVQGQGKEFKLAQVENLLI
jgi:hypothetical protein